jgi:hypothetical protein
VLSFSSKAKKTKKDATEKEEPMDLVIISVFAAYCLRPSFLCGKVTDDFAGPIFRFIASLQFLQSFTH